MPDITIRRSTKVGLASERGLLRAGVLLWSVAAFGLISFGLIGSGAGGGEAKLYLVPWCLATAVVVIAPSAYLLYKGEFDPFHPLVYAGWSYFVPGFVLGGLFISFGISKPYYLSYVADEHYNLPLTLVYVMLGFGGLTLGFAVPYARMVGHLVARRLPSWTWPDDRVLTPGFLLLGLGLANSAIGFSLGVLGYQRPDRVGEFDMIVYLSSFFWIEAALILWIYFFRSPKKEFTEYFTAGLLLLIGVVSSAYYGARGGPVKILILIGFAFALSRRRFTLRHYFAGGLLMAVALVGGMAYGTTFRTVKQSQDYVGIGQITEDIGGTFELLLEQDPVVTFSVGLNAIGDRLDSVSPLAVVVANHEAFAPYEESWGISNNILNEALIALIPRVLWPDKPIPIDPKAYAELYFNFGESAFTITPMGDLLRNFGPLGVPIGMFVLGFFIRVMYASLIEGQEFSYWKSVMFYMLFTSISFEATFGLIFPLLLRFGIFSVIGLLFVQLYIRSTSSSSRRVAAG